MPRNQRRRVRATRWERRLILEVIDGGLQSTLQDLGRFGLRHLGVPWSGAADRLSAALANRLVGNEPNTACVEITLGNAAFRFAESIEFALVGARGAVTLNDKPIAANQAHKAKPGEVLKLGGFDQGCRKYLAVGGGFQATPWLGSTATYLPARVGGYAGRALRRGDQLRVGQQTKRGAMQLQSDQIPALTSSWTLRVVAGPEFHWLDASSQRALFVNGFRLSPQATRMGGALDGAVLGVDPRQLPSCATYPGTVQCPASGQAFLLMADAQTTGGYARIAQVVSADRPLLGQIRPGDRVRFWQIDPDSAAEALKAKMRLYANLQLPTEAF